MAADSFDSLSSSEDADDADEDDDDDDECVAIGGISNAVKHNSRLLLSCTLTRPSVEMVYCLVL